MTEQTVDLAGVPAEVAIFADRPINIDGVRAYNVGDPVPYEAALELGVPVPDGYVPPVDAPAAAEPEVPAPRLVRMQSPGSVTAAGSRRYYVFGEDPVEMDEADAMEVLTDYPELFVEVDSAGNTLPTLGDEKAYATRLKADLVDLAESRGLDTTGTKADLVDRLVADDEARTAELDGEAGEQA